MTTEKIERHGVELSIPSGCEIIDRDYTYGEAMASVIIFHYASQNKVAIICGCRGVYSEYDPKRYGADGYTFSIHNF